ncbi:MAG: leucine-rich repeat domain-containing protein [Clostridia bacterium]|nr:leucine-rich repeat domain-containing protein [Clostridia bacterium]
MRSILKVIATALCAGMVLSSGLFATSPVVMAAGGVAIDSTNFPDENFRKYVKENCDTSGDSVLSQNEIDATRLISLDRQYISSLKGVEFFTALEELTCDSNEITSLDLSKNTNLQILDCSSNQISSLDVSKNTVLRYLSCYDNQLTSLDVSKNVNLDTLFCSSNQLTSLDVSNNVYLVDLLCSNNQLTSLDVSKHTELYELDCSDNQLTSLDVSNNTNLQYLYCDNNQLTSLDVSNNVYLCELLCAGNQLTSLDVSNNEVLYNLSKNITYVTESFGYINLVSWSDFVEYYGMLIIDSQTTLTANGEILYAPTGQPTVIPTPETSQSVGSFYKQLLQQMDKLYMYQQISLQQFLLQFQQ